jgi:PAS domain-containing protein
MNMTEADWAAHKRNLEAHRPFRSLEICHRGEDGQVVWSSVSGEPVFDGGGVFRGYHGTSRDITARKFAEAMIEGQKRVLEMIATSVPIEEVLAALILVVEAQSAGMRASVLLLDADGLHLRTGAAPSLPAEYNAAIDGMEIGPTAGSCGAAVFRREPVIVEDITTDPLWRDFREIAAAHDLRSCWSTPILSSHGRVLGAFAMYYSQPAVPTEQHRRLIDVVVHLAAIGITRSGQEAELRDSEAKSRALAERLQIGQIAAGMIVLEWHIPDDHVDWGYAEERLRGPRPASGKYPVYKDQVHPDDLQGFLAMRARGVASSEAQTGEYRFIRTDGEMRWLR